MYLSFITKITFDPFKDYEIIEIFRESNPDFYERCAGTTGVTFVKEDNYYTEYLIKKKGGPT